MAFIAVPVATWAAGAATAAGGAIAAASASIGAIAGAVAVGVVSGAVIGAATAAISGGDILTGALKGAVIGGISGGVMSGLSMAAGISSGASQMASMGLSPTGAPISASAGVGSTGLAAPALTGPEAGLVPSGLETASAGIEAGTGAIASPQAVQTPQVAASTNIATKAPAERGFFDKMFFDKDGSLSAGTGKIISSGIEGAAKAILTDDDKPETQSEYLQNVQNMNVSGDFESRVANIKVPDFWSKYTKAPTANLNQTQNASLTSQGGSYAQPA